MKCLHPVDCWIVGTRVCKDGIVSPNLIFSPTEALQKCGTSMAFDNAFSPQPCGKCPACLIQKRKDMSVRLTHERSMSEDCCFITLTYDDEHLPKTDCASWSDGSRPILWRGDDFGIATLLPADVQKFMKRLRRHLEYVPKKKTEVRDHVESGKIRYFAVGEYGGKTKRPHYHILIFGWKPSDLKVHQWKKGYTIYRSAQIEKLWTYGFSTIGDVNAGVAKYCARYVTKKYARLESKCVEENWACPEFTLQSVRNGGMGSLWLEKYANNLKSGFVTIRSGEDRISKCSVPRYYYNRLRKVNRPLWLELRDERINFVKSHVRKYDFDQLVRSVEKQRYEDAKALERETL